MVKIPIERLKQSLHEIMYKDVATVYRSMKIVEEDTGATDYEFQVVIENLPCKLSQYKDINANQDDRAQNVNSDFKGETFKLVVGTSFNYITHKVKRACNAKYACRYGIVARQLETNTGRWKFCYRF